MRKCSIKYDYFWQIYKKQCIYLSKNNLKSFFDKNSSIVIRALLFESFYLDEFNKNFKEMVIKAICYADDVLLLVKEFRVTEKLLGTSATYFKKSLKLNMDIEKSRVIRVLSSFYFCIEKE